MFSKIKFNFKNLDSIKNTQYFKNVNQNILIHKFLNITQKNKISLSRLDSIFHMKNRIFINKTIDIYNLDLMRIVEFKIKKQRLVQFFNAETEAFKHGVQKDDIYHLFTKSIYGDEVKFFSIVTSRKDLINSSFSRGKIHFVNPLLIFESIYRIDNSIPHYTILISSNNRYAICNYSHGRLIYAKIKPKNVALYDFLYEIDEVGKIFSFNFTQKNDLEKYEEINVFFNLSQIDFIKVITSIYLYFNPEMTFFSKEINILRICVNFTFFSIISTILYFLLNFGLHEYQKYIKKEEFYTMISNNYLKKRMYTPMYYKIYQKLLSTKNQNMEIK